VKKKTTFRSLKVNFSDIPREGIELTYYLNEDWFKAIAPQGMRFTRQARADVFLEPSASEVNINGSISGEVELTCIRCLKTFPFSLVPKFSLSMVPEEVHHPREKGLKREQLDIDVYQKGVVDIEGVLVDQIMLNLPDYPRCKKDCKGLCPQCGADLNTEQCDCLKKEGGR